jgi:hypothetical protein
VEFLIIGYSIGAPKYRSAITNHFRTWEHCVVVAVLFFQEQDRLPLRDCNGGKKRGTCGAWSGDWIVRPEGCQFVADKGEKGKGSTFLIIAHNIFRIL